MGRNAAKIEDQDRLLAVLSRAAATLAPTGYAEASSANFQAPRAAEDLPRFCEPCRFGRVVGQCRHDDVIPAKPIVASRLRFPGPPAFRPTGFLDEHTLERFDRPFLHALDPADAQREPPRVRILASRSERLELFAKLASSGRLNPVRVSKDRLRFGAGLFAVGKDLERDRLILDCRPANTLERPPSRWTSSLASPACLLQLVIAPDQEIRVSTADL